MKRIYIMFTMITILAIVLSLLYVMVRMSLFMFSDYLWYEKLAALFLLIAELFILVHGIGYFLSVHDDSARYMAGSTANGLDEGSLGPEETLFVCI